jgi:3-hydroxyacyl-[acyl-carrier-protein] dehydratase
MEDNNFKYILEQLPYQEPFLFVDRITQLDSESVVGWYTFREESDFYRGHFKEFPVTPGVLLTECCAQIGLACLGIYLLGSSGKTAEEYATIAMTESHMEFLQPVNPGETVKVTANKEYFRFNKLKVAVHLHNNQGMLACKGHLSGMYKRSQDE